MLHSFIAVFRGYFPLIALPVAVCCGMYGIVLRHAASSDIRNTGSGVAETTRIASLIWLERRSKGHLATKIYAYGLPVFVLLSVAIFIFG